MNSPSETTAAGKAGTDRPVDDVVYRLFTFAPVYIHTGIDAPPRSVDVHEMFGTARDLRAVKFAAPIGRDGDKEIHWLFALPDAAFRTLAEEISRLGMVDRETGQYWRIDRSDVMLKAFPPPETPALLCTPLRVFVFTPSSNKVRRLAAAAGSAFAVVESAPDAMLAAEAEAILGG